MSEIPRRIQEDARTAMRARDRARVAALRYISATLRRAEIDARRELDDDGVWRILERLAKQYREAIAQYRSAGRTELVEKESAELQCLEQYLPAPPDPQELEALISEAVRETGARAPRDLGRVMKELRSRLTDRADLRVVGERVKQILAAP